MSDYDAKEWVGADNWLVQALTTAYAERDAALALAERRSLKQSRCTLRYKRAARRFLQQRDEALRANEWREVQVKRLHMAVQFELNSLPTMREETRAAGLASVADQIERNREGLERIVKSVEALDDIAAAPPPATEDAGGTR